MHRIIVESVPFTTPDRNRVQRLPANDARVTCLHDNLRAILDEIDSLDIALSNRDYISQSVSETESRERIAQAHDLLRSLAGL